MRVARISCVSVLVAAVLITAVLSQRVYVSLDTGQSKSSILQILPIGLALLALGTTIRARGRNLAPLLSRSFLLIWGPYLALALALPVLGVAVSHYPLRTLAAEIIPLVSLSALVLGVEIRTASPRGLAVWGGALMIAVVAQAAYALLQQLTVGHLLPAGPWDPLLAWDVSTQEALGRNVVLGRSSGFYTNPNILGAWAGIAMLAGLFVVQGRARYGLVAATFGALVLGQSRGATVALIAGLGLLLVLAARRDEAPRIRNLLPYGGVVVAVLVGWVVLVYAGAAAGTLVGRVGEGLGVITGGSDPNLSERFQFWGAGIQLLRSHPLGTFGPPELLLGTALDSEWVGALLQGGPIYALALGLALIGGMLPWGTDGPERRVVRALSAFLAVAGLTQLPLQYPPIYLYWALVGAAIAVPYAAAAESPGGAGGVSAQRTS